MAEVAKSDRRQALDLAIASIDRQFGKGAIMRLGQGGVFDEISVIPTGALSLDVALGIGGIPRGRVTEIYGPESSGKTTLALHIIAEAQRMGGTAAFIDAEHALDPIYAKNLGVNTDELLISQPDTGEQALEIAETLVRSNAVDVDRDRLGRGARAARRARRRHGRLAAGPAGAAHVAGAAQAHGGDLALGRGRDLHQPDPREDRRHVRLFPLHDASHPGRRKHGEDRQDREPEDAGGGPVLRSRDGPDRAAPGRELVRQWPCRSVHPVRGRRGTVRRRRFGATREPRHLHAERAESAAGELGGWRRGAGVGARLRPHG